MSITDKSLVLKNKQKEENQLLVPVIRGCTGSERNALVLTMLCIWWYRGVLGTILSMFYCKYFCFEKVFIKYDQLSTFLPRYNEIILAYELIYTRHRSDYFILSRHLWHYWVIISLTTVHSSYAEWIFKLTGALNLKSTDTYPMANDFRI